MIVFLKCFYVPMFLLVGVIVVFWHGRITHDNYLYTNIICIKVTSDTNMQHLALCRLVGTTCGLYWVSSWSVAFRSCVVRYLYYSVQSEEVLLKRFGFKAFDKNKALKYRLAQFFSLARRERTRSLLFARRYFNFVEQALISNTVLKCLYQDSKVSGHVFVCCRVSILLLSTTLIFDFGIVLTVVF